MAGFTHLHLHTHYSILDGAADIKSIMQKAKETGMTAIAITDHGNMFGVPEFFFEAKAFGIKPIIGCEVYVAPTSRFEKKGKKDRSGHHLILLAKNKKGYFNLSRLCTLAYLEGKYYTPRVDKELLRQYSEGLIATSACTAGEIQKTIIYKNKDEAEKVLYEYLEIFGEDFYLEIQNHGLEEQRICKEVFLEWSKKHNIKIIASNDVHFINKEDAEAHDILVCIKTQSEPDETDRLRYTGKEFLLTPQEASQLFADIPEAIANISEVVDKIESYDITQKVILPKYDIPENFSNDDEYLRHLAYEGAKKKYGEITPSIKERLDYELDVVKNMGFAGYFLIVSDFIRQAKMMGVSVGPGRGSAAGSAISYCIDITNIDPLKYNLLFERFLNPERISLPDIDVDFDEDGRQKIIDWVATKYGADKVAQVITFGTMGARMAIRDVARVMNMPLQEADRLAKLVPEGEELAGAIKEIDELRQIKETGSELERKTLFFAEKLEGTIRQTGVHACGVIIGTEPLINHIPLCITKEEKSKTDLIVTQYEGKYVVNLGFLKMDFLGLKNLSTIKDSLANIKRTKNIDLDIDNIPLDDKKTYELFQRGETIGTFQFESEGMRKYLKELKPTNIEDLIAMNALYRPGPMEYIHKYINRKHGKEKVEYPHPMLENILKNTYGIMVYQEQIMQTAQIMAGFTPAEADILREAMGKKKTTVMRQQKKKFVEGAKKQVLPDGTQGITEQKAEEIFDIMAEFGKYGFNRSHSASYSIIAYQTTYLKAHYPAEFKAALLTRHIGNIDKIGFYMEECRRQGIKVLPPSINESDYKFTVHPVKSPADGGESPSTDGLFNGVNKLGEIRFGLAAIKDVSFSAVEAIVKERSINGHYKDFYEFIKRVNLQTVNKKVLESLVLAGAFDCFKNIHRAQYFASANNHGETFIEMAIKYGNKYQSYQAQSNTTLFDGVGGIEISDPQLPVCKPWPLLKILEQEKQVIGIYISGHPLDKYKLEITSFTNFNLSQFKEIEKYKNKEVSIAGMVTSVKQGIGKNDKPFITFTIEDFTESYKTTLFSDDYARFKGYLVPGTFLYIKGKIGIKFKDTAKTEFIINNIHYLSDIKEKLAKGIIMLLSLSDITSDFADVMHNILNKHKGNYGVKIIIEDAMEDLKVEMLTKKYKVNLSEEFFSELDKIKSIQYALF